MSAQNCLQLLLRGDSGVNIKILHQIHIIVGDQRFSPGSGKPPGDMSCFQNDLLCSLNPDHPVSHANVCLDVLGRIRGRFQLLAQGGHEDPKGRHVAVPALSPDILGNKRMRQNLPHISGEETQ